MSIDYINEITKLVPPPNQPIHSLSKQNYIDKIPDDFQRFLSVYGSGEFWCKGKGAILTPLNIADPSYTNNLDFYNEIISDFKDAEGDEYIPYEIYPQKGGIFLWGFSDSRVFYFWLSKKDDPNDWEVLTVYDYGIFAEFQMSTTKFLYYLFAGKLDYSQFGWSSSDNYKIDSKDVYFKPLEHQKF
ncbi:hypothetical protein Pan241w_04200 [Gimesia alba]|uniref:SMI1 / KNR4 family protein n=1 Tax=Gimesia alba TaxID=2527973 RepID=A0A517R8Z2_9PLAN|nr:hypothetical protein [Gimesia alba]QDT40364.1 hypothetical protein Pan241w_04200 [Gimesia alba]